MSAATSFVAASAIACAVATGADAASALVHRIDRQDVEALPQLGRRARRWQGWQIRLTVDWGARSVELFLDDGGKAAMTRELLAARALVPTRSDDGPVVRRAIPRPRSPLTTTTPKFGSTLRAVLRDLEVAVVAADPTREMLSALRVVSETRAVALHTMQGFRGAYEQGRSAVDVVSRTRGGADVVRSLAGALDHADDVRRAWVEAVFQETTLRTGVRHMKTTRADVVLAPRVVSELMGLVADCTVLPFLRGDGTFLSKCRGARVASCKLSLVDHAVRGSRARCRPFDDEGVKARTVRLIEDGVFSEVLTNRYFAAHYRERPSGSLTKPFRSAGVIRPTNLVLAPGASPFSDLLHEGKLYITDLMGFAFDPRSGGFSRSAAGFTLRRGRLHEAVGGFLFVGRLRELLMNVAAVGSDATDTGSGVFPSLLVRDVEIVG